MFRAIDAHAADQINPVLFIGDDISGKDLAPFRDIAVAEIIRTHAYNADQQLYRLAQALLWGVDHAAAKIFKENFIDVAFESATFYGWRFPIPCIAWIPDFQHRCLPYLFDIKSYWKRELGFRAQVMSGRKIMLSSEVARQDCEHFYPSTIGRTAVVRFAVSPVAQAVISAPSELIEKYKLPASFFYIPNQFWKHKNHLVVIEALDILKRRGYDVVVAASGNPEDPRHPGYYGMLKSHVISRGLEKNFLFLGMVPYQDLIALMKTCTALINPSLFEGWSTTVEEAKSLGVPMLLSDLPVHREQVESGATFFHPELAEELAEMMIVFTVKSGSKRQENEEFTRNESLIRVRKFAQEFSALIEYF